MTSGLRPIAAVAEAAGLECEFVVPFGRDRAKVSLDALEHPGSDHAAHVLVSAVTPTPAGEGKTLTSIGLAMGLHDRGRRAIVALRQSSLGPTFGSKGGGAGGGKAAIEPLDESVIGVADDLFGIEMANNLLAAVVDEHLARGREPRLDPRAITWRRVVDVDDRALRSIVTGLAGPNGGMPRASGFDITAASEVMAVVALARDRADLRRRLGRIVVAFDSDDRPVTAEDLEVAGAMAALVQRAFAPNLLQTSSGTPAIVHGGPFANIAHGNSSVVADLIASTRNEFVITEAGFATELGAEKYFHLKVPITGMPPSATVLVATARAIRDHDPAGDLAPGLANLRAHVRNLSNFAVPVIAAINRFPDDAPGDLAEMRAAAIDAGAVAVVEHHAYTRGGEGCRELADAVTDVCRAHDHADSNYAPLISRDAPVTVKVERIATTLYGAAAVEWEPRARRELERLARAGFGDLGVCVAKTHRSLSHDPARRGAPSGFTFPVRDVRLAAGAEHLVVYAGDIVTMPGLAASARYRSIDVDSAGRIVGLA